MIMFMTRMIMIRMKRMIMIRMISLTFIKVETGVYVCDKVGDDEVTNGDYDDEQDDNEEHYRVRLMPVK